MATKEDDFKARFIAVMQDLREAGREDSEAMWLMGSLAARLVDAYKAKDWSDFKARMVPPIYDKLLKDFETQGNEFHRNRKVKQAYAVQVLAMSLIARTQKDRDVQTGDKLLDDTIDATILAYRRTKATEPKPN